MTKQISSVKKEEDAMARPWTFLSNHGHVLVVLHHEPDARIEDVAASVGITPRSAQMIIRDLVAAGHVERTRAGRRNHYRIVPGSLRHPEESFVDLGRFLALFDREEPGAPG
jgi:DNA-binding MarR family transcriptional regulator